MAGRQILTKGHIFNPAKKITNILVTRKKDEYEILQINFFHYGERLVKVGCSDRDLRDERVDRFLMDERVDRFVRDEGGRFEVF